MKPEPGRSKSIPVTTNIVERIKKWAKPEFDPEVLSYPLGLCRTCRKQLTGCERLGVVSPGLKAKWDAFKLQDIHIPRGQESSTCCCDICTARRTNCSGVGVTMSVKIVPKGEPEKEQNEEETPDGSLDHPPSLHQ